MRFLCPYLTKAGGQGRTGIWPRGRTAQAHAGGLGAPESGPEGRRRRHTPLPAASGDEAAAAPRHRPATFRIQKAFAVSRRPRHPPPTEGVCHRALLRPQKAFAAPRCCRAAFRPQKAFLKLVFRPIPFSETSSAPAWGETFFRNVFWASSREPPERPLSRDGDRSSRRQPRKSRAMSRLDAAGTPPRPNRRRISTPTPGSAPRRPCRPRPPRRRS